MSHFNSKLHTGMIQSLWTELLEVLFDLESNESFVEPRRRRGSPSLLPLPHCPADTTHNTTESLPHLEWQPMGSHLLQGTRPSDHVEDVPRHITH